MFCDSVIQGAWLHLEYQNKKFLVWTSSSVNKSILLGASLKILLRVSKVIDEISGKSNA